MRETGRNTRSAAGSRRASRAAAVLAAALVLAAAAPGASAAEPTWLDADGNTLPFGSDAEVLDFLRRAPVIGYEQLTGGSNDPFRLELDLPGYRVRAIFRNVDIVRRDGSSAAARLFPSFRDSYAFEVAAYELSRLLGLDNVPPAILYEWRGQRGSLQLWVEEARTEGERLQAGEAPPDPAAWHRQRTSMLVFDNLIFNFDRNHGNQLLDARGKLWFIDHTRSFKSTPSLPSKQSIVVVDAALWQRLQELDRATLEATLGPYLDLPQMDALRRRHRQLVEHIARLIAERGEAQVLLSKGPPSPAEGPGA